MTIAIEVERLHRAYGDRQVLRGVSFTVRTGEVFALLGPNGAGKTTTIEILEGHRRRDDGKVRVLEFDPANGGRRFRERIGIVLQQAGVEGDLTVAEAVRLAAGLYHAPNDWRDVVDLVGLTAMRRQRVRTLSAGQMRRLDLALGLVGNPEVLFLDEPTTGFDPEARRDAWKLIAGLRDRGMTIVLTSHYLEEVEALADHVAILHRGRVALSGSPAELVRGRPSMIRFRADPRATAVLVDLHPGIRIDGDRVELRTAEPAVAVHALVSWASANGHRIVDLTVGPPSLEDVYLNAVGRRG